MKKQFKFAENRLIYFERERMKYSDYIKRHPIYDADGTPVEVGDKVKFQICTGRYGQTASGESTVKYIMPNYPGIGLTNGKMCHVNYDFDKKIWRCFKEHVDFEHGHKTWLVVSEKARVNLDKAKGSI